MGLWEGHSSPENGDTSRNLRHSHAVVLHPEHLLERERKGRLEWMLLVLELLLLLLLHRVRRREEGERSKRAHRRWLLEVALLEVLKERCKRERELLLLLLNRRLRCLLLLFLLWLIIFEFLDKVLVTLITDVLGHRDTFLTVVTEEGH